MTRSQRNALRERFGFACGYCDVTEASAGSELTVGHFQPTIAQGTDDESNWVYACHACYTRCGIVSWTMRKNAWTVAGANN